MGGGFIICILLIILHEGIHADTDTSKIVINTPLGLIEGYVGYTVNSHPFYKFEGVPYAKPPTGELRFEEPQDVEPWDEIWKANVLTRCLQYDQFDHDVDGNYRVHGNEDCLHVNIYTQTTNTSANLDVLFHIHGGAFMFGRGGNFGPDIIMERDIVFISFNYRLGPLGLFTHGISQSGCALNPWVLAENVREKAIKVASVVGCTSSSSAEIKKCLKTKPAIQIVRTVREFQPFLYNPFSPFGVVVDGQWASKPILPEHPYLLLKKGKVLDAPWMVSYTKDEGLYPAADFWADKRHLAQIDTKWNEVMPFILHYNETTPSDLKDAVSQQIRTRYMENKHVNRETYSTFVEILSDRLFKVGLETSARLLNAVVASDIYSYSFNYRGRTSKTTARTKSDDNLGISHGDDTIYVLYNNQFNTYSTEEDRKMSKALIDIVTSFMKDGKPNITTEWQPLVKARHKLFRQLNIYGPEHYEMEYVNELDKSSFWESLPFLENHNLFEVLNREEL